MIPLIASVTPETISTMTSAQMEEFIKRLDLFRKWYITGTDAFSTPSRQAALIELCRELKDLVPYVASRGQMYRSFKINGDTKIEFKEGANYVINTAPFPLQSWTYSADYVSEHLDAVKGYAANDKKWTAIACKLLDTSKVESVFNYLWTHQLGIKLYEILEPLMDLPRFKKLKPHFNYAVRELTSKKRDREAEVCLYVPKNAPVKVQILKIIRPK